MKIKNHAYLVAGSALLFAASQTNAALEEIVVTATKRAETIQDVPVSVAAVSADMMDKIGIADMEAITNPNVIPRAACHKGMSGGQLNENKTVDTKAPSLISCFLTTANKVSQPIPTTNTVM